MNLVITVVQNLKYLHRHALDPAPIQDFSYHIYKELDILGALEEGADRSDVFSQGRLDLLELELEVLLLACLSRGKLLRVLP